MEIQLIRHATLLLKIKNKTILVDPMFASKVTIKSITTKKSGNHERNPIIELPCKEDVLNIFKTLDAILITHLHFDHFFETNELKIPRSIPIICQKDDEKKLRALGFTRITSVVNKTNWNKIEFMRINCNHGGAILKNLLGKNSGFVIKSNNEPKVYITGDTVYCKHVEKGLKEKPDITIINAGGARLPFGRSITMNEEDVSRDKLRKYLSKNDLLSRVKIPGDGECFEYTGGSFDNNQ
jgi:L-ascorbate metabolism protein UlaG (beta-lactamase superfamily)